VEGPEAIGTEFQFQKYAFGKMTADRRLPLKLEYGYQLRAIVEN
jgi:hypothetical protein